MDAAKAVRATFVSLSTLTSLGSPKVTKVRGGFRVRLRFKSAQSGVAHVRALRAGRVVASLSRRVRAGQAASVSLRVARAGRYTFAVRLGTSGISWRVCVGRC
jgi:hypothetical protein